jgi:hypothetical protein
MNPSVPLFSSFEEGSYDSLSQPSIRSVLRVGAYPSIHWQHQRALAPVGLLIAGVEFSVAGRNTPSYIALQIARRAAFQ